MKRVATGLVLLFSATVAWAEPDYRPVTVGGDSELDACSGWGITLATTVMFVPLPDGNWMFDVVPAGTGVSFCDTQEGYTGVVVPKFEGQDCGVGSPISKKQPYNGVCKSGWIKNTFVDQLAG